MRSALVCLVLVLALLMLVLALQVGLVHAAEPAAPLDDATPEASAEVDLLEVEAAVLAQRAFEQPTSIEAEVDRHVFRLIPEKKSLALFLAAQTLIVIDMGQTLDIRNHPGVEESNPILGREPSRGRVFALFGTRLALNTLAHWLLPDRWANGLSMVNIAVGIPVVANNASLGLSVAF